MKVETAKTGALMAVSIAACVGFVRVFDGLTFAPPLIGVVVAAHLAARATSRTGRGLSQISMIVLGVLATSASTALGAWLLGDRVPTDRAQLSSALAAARTVVAHGSAPTEPIPGLILVASLVLWLCAWSADRLNFHYRAPIEALAPTIGVFGVVTLMAGPHHRWSSTALFAAAVTAHLLVERNCRPAYRAGTEDRFPVTRTALGMTMAVTSILGGLAVAASVPQLHTDGVLSIRTDLRDGPPRSVVSPLVDIRRQLVDQNNTELLEVHASTASYWRLMTLDQFDGTVWSSDQQYRVAHRSLSPGVADTGETMPSKKLVATYDVTGLTGPWAPVAYRATNLEGTKDLLWDRDGSTLIVRASVGSVSHLKYRATSAIPMVDAARVAAARGPIPARIRDDDLTLPDDFPSDLRRLAHDITGQESGPYAKALALQRYFRDNPHFVYSLDVSGGEGYDAIRSFLRTGVGFCEQYAGTFAALARAAGLPSRIAVGFTQGTDRAGTFIVRGDNAHAWPEIYFAGLGWLPFEPTPGRANPIANAYANTTPAPPTSPSGSSPTTTRTSTATPGSGPTVAPQTTGTPTPPPTIASVPPGSGDTKPKPTSPVGVLAICLAAALIAALGPLLRKIERSRRRARASTPARKVGLVWQETLEAWRPLQFVASPAETARDLGNRLAGRIENLPDATSVAPMARRLAQLTTIASWQEGAVTDVDVAEASECGSHLIVLARRHQSVPSRIARWFFPRVSG